ncbi:MAG TPA: hypothetical protein VGB42_07280 [Candidatus Thermoplasmatota archaeon]
MRGARGVPKGKPAIKEIVDEHLHRPGASPAALTLRVRDRRAPSGTAALPGTDISGVHGGFIELRDGRRVPLHRVVEVRSGGRRLWPPG